MRVESRFYSSIPPRFSQGSDLESDNPGLVARSFTLVSWIGGWDLWVPWKIEIIGWTTFDLRDVNELCDEEVKEIVVKCIVMIGPDMIAADGVLRENREDLKRR